MEKYAMDIEEIKKRSEEVTHICMYLNDIFDRCIGKDCSHCMYSLLVRKEIHDGQNNV